MEIRRSFGSRLRALVPILAAALLLAACGSASDAETADEGVKEETDAAAADTSQPAANELVHYDPVGLQLAPETNPLPATSTGEGVTVSDLEHITNVDSSGDNRDVRPTLMSVGPLDVTESFHVKFTVTPDDPALGLSVSALSYDYLSYSPGATGTISLRTSADAFASTVDSKAWIGGTAPEVTTLTFDASNVPLLQGPLEVRLYMHDLVIESPDVTGEVDWADLVSSAVGGNGLILLGGVDTPT